MFYIFDNFQFSDFIDKNYVNFQRLKFLIHDFHFHEMHHIDAIYD